MADTGLRRAARPRAALLAVQRIQGRAPNTLRCLLSALHCWHPLRGSKTGLRIPYFSPRAQLRRFKEMEAYILQRRDELTGRNRGGAPSGGSKAAEPAAAAPKGFS